MNWSDRFPNVRGRCGSQGGARAGGRSPGAGGVLRRVMVPLRLSVALRVRRSARLAVFALSAFGAFLAPDAGAAPARWPTTVDVDPGETVIVTRGGTAHTFRILADAQGQPAITYETMPFPTTAVDKRVNYAARVRLAVDGQEVELIARPFQYPVTAAGLRLYLDGTREWLGTDDVYPLRLPKRIRLRFTAAGESWGPAGLRFPVGEYRWHATTYNNTWLGVVPQDVSTTYYHKGEDFGAVPDLLPVLAPEAGVASTDGTGVQTLSSDGTLFWAAHMNAANIAVAAGQQVAAGQVLGLTGNRGNSNADPHVHYDISWGDEEVGSFPFAADAYLRDYPDAGIVVAGGYQFLFAGETLALDGRRSLARPGRTITGYRWILHDGTVVDGPSAVLTAPTAGFYAEELRVFFDDGREERGFTQVRVFNSGSAGQLPLVGFLYQYPLRGIKPGEEMTIRHHPFASECYSRTIDFGDGSPVQTVSGPQPTIAHRYAAPGLYTVTVRANSPVPQVLKTSVLVEGSGGGANLAPVIAGPAVRQLRAVAERDLIVALAGSDPDGDSLDWSIGQIPVQGSASVGPDGVVLYRSVAGYVGDDSFEVALADGRGGTATVRLEVAVQALPVVGPAGVRIEAEDYDEGGEGVAYHDVDGRQGTSQVRTDGSGHDVDIVAIEPGVDFPGLKIGYTEPGEWLCYTLSVPVSGRYSLRLRVANGSGGASTGAISLRWKGAVVAGPLTVPATGSWDSFVDLDVPGVALSSGTDGLQLDCNTGGFDVNWLELVPAGVAPYVTWIAGHFPDGVARQTDPSADPDGDGLNNILEYGLARRPDLAESPLVPTFVTVGGNRHAALTFKRAVGVSVVAEISDDLVVWSSAPADLVPFGAAEPDGAGLFETVTFRSTTALAAKPRQFLRVRVTAP